MGVSAEVFEFMEDPCFKDVKAKVMRTVITRL